MIDPAEDVFAYVSSTVGLSSSVASRPSTLAEISRFMLAFAWCSHIRRSPSGVRPSSPICSPIISATIGTTSRNTLRPSCRNSLSGAPTPSGAARFRNPKLLRILFENCVFSFVPRIFQCAAGAIVSFSISTAVATSPKMKWLSRSVKLRWPEQISGFTISTDLACPARTKSAAVCIPNVAEEHATFMSKAKPSMPSACCTSIAIAG